MKIDEVAIWNRGLSDDEWKMVNDFGSAYDKNYNSISGKLQKRGMSPRI